MKISELIKSKHVIAAGNSHPEVPQTGNASRESEADDSFRELDGTNPEKPYTHAQIMKAMKELHARIERQAANYGGEVDHKTGKIDRSKHKFFQAQIAPDE